MIWYVIMSLTLLITIMSLLQGWTEDKKVFYIRLVLSFIVVPVIGAFSGLILCVLPGSIFLEWRKTGDYSQPIVSLKSETSINGNFTLGSGAFGGFRKYYFMMDLGNEYYDESWVRISACSIRESDNHPPSFSYEHITGRPPDWCVPSWFPDTEYSKQK